MALRCSISAAAPSFGGIYGKDAGGSCGLAKVQFASSSNVGFFPHLLMHMFLSRRNLCEILLELLRRLDHLLVLSEGHVSQHLFDAGQVCSERGCLEGGEFFVTGSYTTHIRSARAEAVLQRRLFV